MDRNNHTKSTRWLAIIVFLSMQILSTKADVVTVWTTVKVPAPAPTAPLSPSYTSLNEFKDGMLKVTNEYRANHDANPLQWNNTLADYSREWAEACIWKHSVCINKYPPRPRDINDQHYYRKVATARTSHTDTRMSLRLSSPGAMNAICITLGNRQASLRKRDISLSWSGRRLRRLGVLLSTAGTRRIPKEITGSKCRRMSSKKIHWKKMVSKGC